MQKKGSQAAMLVVGGLLSLVMIVVLLFAGGTDTSTPSDDSTDAVGFSSGGLQSAGEIPAAWMPVFLQAGKTCPEVTPALLAAQTEQESHFQDTGMNNAGAEGPSQFILSTWAAYGNGGNIHDYHDSIPAQARYDCAIAKIAKEDVAKGLAHGDLTTLILIGYNAGPERIAKYHGNPHFEETIGYVNIIEKAMAKFEAPGGTTLGSATIEAIISDAVSQVGKPYLLGAGGPGRDEWPMYDCSGLVSWAVWKGTGGKITLPHYAASIRLDPHLQQIEIGKDLSKMKRGDIIVFDLPGEDPKPWGHTAIYLGGGQIVEATDHPHVRLNDLTTGWGGYYMRPNYQWDVLRIKGV